MFLKYLRALTAFAATLLFCAASYAEYQVDILPPATPVARDAYVLQWGIMWVCVVIFIIVFGAMFWSIFKHRRSVGAKAAQFHENTTIEVIWTIVPLVVMVGMAWPATKTMLEMKDSSNAEQEVDARRVEGQGRAGVHGQLRRLPQPTGKGMPPAFPPLDGSKVVNGPKAAQIALVLKSKPGTAMASFAQLSDTNLAAVITHARNAWGNKTGEAIQPAEIKAARK